MYVSVPERWSEMCLRIILETYLSALDRLGFFGFSNKFLNVGTGDKSVSTMDLIWKTLDRRLLSSNRQCLELRLFWKTHHHWSLSACDAQCASTELPVVCQLRAPLKWSRRVCPLPSQWHSNLCLCFYVSVRDCGCYNRHLLQTKIFWTRFKDIIISSQV